MKYRYRSEEEMKDSGVEWIGKLPKGWEIKRLKFLGELNSNGVDKKIEENEPLYKSIHYMNVYKNSLKEIGDSDDYLIVSADKTKADNCGLRAGDVLFTNSSETPEDIGHSTVINENLNNTLFGYHLMRLRPSVKTDLSFEKYMFGSNYIRKWFAFRAKGITRYGILSEDFANASLALPSFVEQQKLSSFLDEKVTSFNTIISKKEALIQRLEEAKKSLISEVVTGKVKVVKTSEGYELVERKKEEMKVSGVEWLGEIPNIWESKAVKYLFQLRNERNIKEMSDVQLLSLFTALGVMKQGEVEARGNKVRTVEDYKEVYPNDIVVNIILAWMGAIGMSEYRGVISPAYDIYKPVSSYVNSKYYHYLFRTNRFSGECYKKGRGIMEMRWRTYSDEFKSIIVTVPSLEEQNIIVEFLDNRITSIDKLVERINSQIEKLKQAKQSLISEAVTGKIEVLED